MKTQIEITRWEDLPTVNHANRGTLRRQLSQDRVSPAYRAGYICERDRASLYAVAPRHQDRIGDFIRGWLDAEADAGQNFQRAFHSPEALDYQVLLDAHPDAQTIEFSCKRQARFGLDTITWNKAGNRYWKVIAPSASVQTDIYGAMYLTVASRRGFRALYLALEILPSAEEREKIHASWVAGRNRWMVDKGLLPADYLLADH